MSQNVLVVGGGGREHALVWKLAQSKRIGKLYIAPGNGGTDQMGQKVTNVPIDVMNFHGLARFAKNNHCFTVIGPDGPLSTGIVDFFEANDLSVFGPRQQAAVIESSKATAKDMMKGAGVPTARFQIFHLYNRACAYVENEPVPIVVKANGLTLGKGVYVCESIKKAEIALKKIMIERIYGQAGDMVLVEEFLGGPEVSVHALCDGDTFILFPLAQDHKPIRENDQGENTGGMGTIVPMPWVQKETMRFVSDKIVAPMLGKLIQCNRRFKGLLYPGLKITKEGPKVLEFNTRFGDPETQSYMRLLETDLLDLLMACSHGELRGFDIKWRQGFAATVVLASGGYPSKYEKGLPISGMENAKRITGVEIFHAGTTFDDGFKTSGGRVLGVSGVGDTLQAALDCAYEGVRCISFKGMYYRRDIGQKALTMTL